MGYRADHVIETAADGAAAAAHADASWAKQQTALANLTATKRKSAAAATDTVLASRADYFENYAGRWISIEARPSDNSPVRADNPVMTAAWDSGPGTPLGGAGQEGILQAFIDTDPPDADYYLYHFNTFRVGALDDGKPMPSQVRVASANGGVDTIPVKRWTSKDGKGFPTQLPRRRIEVGAEQPVQVQQQVEVECCRDAEASAYAGSRTSRGFTQIDADQQAAAAAGQRAHLAQESERLDGREVADARAGIEEHRPAAEQRGGSASDAEKSSPMPVIGSAGNWRCRHDSALRRNSTEMSTAT